MYKIMGLVIFIFLLVWNVTSGNHKLAKRVSELEHNQTINLEIIRTKTNEIMELDLLLNTVYDEQSDLYIIIDRLTNELNVSKHTEPIIKWKTIYKTNPLYVKCTK